MPFTRSTKENDEPSSASDTLDILNELKKLNDKIDQFKDSIVNEVKGKIAKLEEKIVFLQQKNNYLSKKSDTQSVIMKQLEEN